MFPLQMWTFIRFLATIFDYLLFWIERPTNSSLEKMSKNLRDSANWEHCVGIILCRVRYVELTWIYIMQVVGWEEQTMTWNNVSGNEIIISKPWTLLLNDIMAQLVAQPQSSLHDLQKHPPKKVLDALLKQQCILYSEMSVHRTLVHWLHWHSTLLVNQSLQRVVGYFLGMFNTFSIRNLPLLHLFGSVLATQKKQLSLTKGVAIRSRLDLASLATGMAWQVKLW